MPQQLLQPIFDAPLRSIAYFNGRLLTAEDLLQDRQAGRELIHRLARAVGDGIAFGCEVTEATGVSTPSAPTVRVASGLAVNRTGHPLCLNHPVELQLIRSPDPLSPDASGGFADCLVDASARQGNAGLFLLVISPARRNEGQVQASGIATAVASCNNKYVVEGVQFRTVPLPLTIADLSDPDRLRNDAAHRCFGVISAAYRQRFLEPFNSVVENYGQIDDLRAANVLTNCDVPLALLRLTSSGLSFIDNWAVRRRIVRPDAGPPGPFPTDRRTAEGEAMIAQFPEHLRDLLARTVLPANVTARTFFRRLPPAGLLPNGVDPLAFFRTEDSSPVNAVVASPVDVIEPSLLPDVFRRAALYPPMDVNDAGGISLYEVRESNSLPTTPPMAWLFTHPQLRVL